MSFAVTPQHEAIFAWVADPAPAQPALIIDAVAGSGKSSTLIEILRRLPTTSSAAFLAFNKSAATEIEEKAKRAGLDNSNVQFRTLNAFGFRALTTSNRRVNVDSSIVRKRLAQHVGGWEEKTFASMVGKLVGAAKSQGLIPAGAKLQKKGLVDDSDQTWRSLMAQFQIDPPADDWSLVDKAISLARRVLVEGLRDLNNIDFDDQIFLPWALDIPLPRVDWLLCDEAQDLAPTQRAMLRSSIRGGGRLIAVGDPHQCHPLGTMVEMTGGGKKRIEEVEVGDIVVTYHDCFRGIKSQGRRVEAVASFDHAGEVVDVTVDGRTVSMTDNHRVPTRIAANGGMQCVYLMESGNVSRIGRCLLQYTSGFGPAMRMRHERADRVWVLAVFDNDEDASVYETMTALRFGLPENIFFEKGAIRTRLMEAIGDNRHNARACLEEHGRRYEFPLAKRESGEVGQKVGRKIYVTEACNLIDGVNEMRTFDGTRDGGAWAHVKTARRYYRGKVVGITVEPTDGGLRLYVADGVLVHNSIYGWRGADCDSLGAIGRDYNATTLPLSTTYRCPQTVTEMARQFVPHFECPASSPVGTITSIDTTEDGKKFDAIEWRTDDLVVCRNNAPLVTMAYKLMRRRVPVRVAGRAIGTAIHALIRKLRPTSPQDLVTKITKHQDAMIAKARARDPDDDEKVQKIVDECETALVFAQESETLADLDHMLSTMFADDGTGQVTLSSVHRAKGAEAPRVFVLDYWRMPSKMARTAEAKQQEQNLIYVALTRARSELVFLTISTKKPDRTTQQPSLFGAAAQ
jgi:superfamily I DNA/RNA helicase